MNDRAIPTHSKREKIGTLSFCGQTLLSLLYVFTGLPSALCDFIGYTCFYQAMSNVTAKLSECRECPDDCDEVAFLTMPTPVDYAEQDLEFAE